MSIGFLLIFFFFLELFGEMSAERGKVDDFGIYKVKDWGFNNVSQ